MGSFEDRRVRGTVFNIQKYSVHDGPGIRTIVFLKGCPLSCLWCSNPESQSPEPELAYNAGRCLTPAKCGRCVKACPAGAIAPGPDGTALRIDRSRCGKCGLDCAAACPAQGLIVYGQEKSVGEIMETVEQDSLFYARSGGGMTLSGGEPLMQAAFALALIREARARRVRVAIETCGCVPWEVLKAAAEHLNNVLFDVKHMKSGPHEKGTGVRNQLILANLERLLTEFPRLPVLVRTPIIPGFNDTEDNARDLGRFLAGHANVSYEALPYHRLGTQKYAFLGRECLMGDVALPADAAGRLQKITDEERGAQCR